MPARGTSQGGGRPDEGVEAISPWITAAIGLGSNLGEREKNLKTALERIGRLDNLEIAAVSGFYLTEPIGRQDQGWFLNGAALVKINMPPRDLLGELLGIEREMGRIRTEKWGPRLIDLDILFIGSEVIQEPTLEIPHPHLSERRFVLLPLIDIAPDWVHPVLGLTPGEMLDKLPLKGQEAVPL